MRIDINSDTGESFGAYTIGHDAGLFRSITSANVAAGFHAGDPSVLRDTIRLAKAHGVAVGVHPGFPDLVGFGRRELHVTPREAEDFVLYQIAAVAGVAAAEGVAIQHVKPHGALFNMAVRHADLADAIARAVAAFDRTLILFGRPGSEILTAGRTAGLRVAAEVFADRAYEADGSLTSRYASPARSSTIPPPSSLAPSGWSKIRRWSPPTGRSCAWRPTPSACTATRPDPTISPRRSALASKPPVSPFDGRD